MLPPQYYVRSVRSKELLKTKQTAMPVLKSVKLSGKEKTNTLLNGNPKKKYNFSGPADALKVADEAVSSTSI